MEADLTQSERLQQGIFFTRPNIVEQITRRLDLGRVHTVIDTAAGSCNFLVPLARRYPDKIFYGIERNTKVYRATRPSLERLPNLHYKHGDLLTDKFDIPECDLYLGNPPFVNFADLPEEDKEIVKNLWPQYFKNAGFSMLLGESRGDIAQLVFYHSVAKYLKSGGQFAVILPNSLLKGNKASSGFRELRNLSVADVYDLPAKGAFEHSNRNSFYLHGRKGGATTFPLRYHIKGETHQLYRSGEDFVQEKPVLTGESAYRARQGVNTLGANDVFFFKEKPDLEGELLHPLLKSSDVQAWRSQSSYWALLPYLREDLIEEDELKQKYPKAFGYLQAHKPVLEARRSRFAQHSWYALFGIGDYTFAPFKVVWQALGARAMAAAVVEEAIPNQAMHAYFSTQNEEEAYYLCGIVNSRIFTRELTNLSEAGSKSFALPSVFNKLQIPKYHPRAHKLIAQLSRELHENFRSMVEEKLHLQVEQMYAQYQGETKH